MAYKIDPDVLHTVAKQVIGLPLEGGELVASATEMLAAEYPDLIHPSPGRWIGSKAGGILWQGSLSLLQPPRVRPAVRVAHWHTRFFGPI